MANKDFTFEFDRNDFAHLNQMCNNLSYIDKNQAIMNSLSQGMGLITRQGKANLTARNKSRTGNLFGSISKKRVKKWMSVYAGFKRSGTHKGNHAHLVDRGTTVRWTKKGYYRGYISKGNANKGSMFWTDAVETKSKQAMNKVNSVIHKEIEKITMRKH